MAYVMMAIPAELVPAVTELVEGRLRDLPDSVFSAAGEDGFVHGWNGEAVRRAYRESADKMRALLVFLADHPDREVSSEEMAEAINAKFGWNTVAGMLGAFSRRCANRYGRSKPMWEFRYDDADRILITMPPQVAKIIKDAEKTPKVAK